MIKIGKHNNNIMKENARKKIKIFKMAICYEKFTSTERQGASMCLQRFYCEF
jgi:hypothetical protein